jgi:putative ABC transport system permease protein
MTRRFAPPAWQTMALSAKVAGVPRANVGAAGFVLLVACANIANLLLARAATRDGELAVRTALGASRSRLVRQSLAEAAVLGIMGAVVGLGACVAARRPIAAVIPADLYRAAAVDIDVRIAAFTATLMVGTTLLFGVPPALRGTRVSPGASSDERSHTGCGSAGRTQRTLRSSGGRSRGRAAHWRRSPATQLR